MTTVLHATDPFCCCGSTDLVSGWWGELRWAGCRYCGALYFDGGRKVGTAASARAWVEVQSRGATDRLALFACPWCLALPAPLHLADHVRLDHGDRSAAALRDALGRAAA